MIKRPLGLGCLAVVLLLCIYVNLVDAPYIDYSAYQGKKVTVTGKVYKKETVMQTKGPASVLYLDLKDSTDGREENTGPPGEKVICYLKADQPDAQIGSWVRLEGKLSCFERASNPGQFDAYSYYQISGISYRINQAEIKAKTTTYNKFTNAMYKLRVFFAEKIKEGFDVETASLMQTILLGEKGSLDKDLKALYQRNGVAHILAISGLHISVLGMGLYKLLRKCGIPMKMSAGISAIVMFLYAVMTGFSVSAIRAVFMFVIHMAAVILERTYDMLTALAVAAVLLLFRQPRYLFHSGFVFSFGCVLGIALLMPLLTEAVKGRNFMIRAVTSGLGMSIITLPIYLWFYYQYPVYSIFLNLLILPVMSFLMAAGIGVILFQIICPQLAVPFIWFVESVFHLIEIFLHLGDRLPGLLLTVGRPEKWKMICYLLVLLLLITVRKKTKPLIRWCMILPAAVLLLCPVEKIVSKEMEITFLDVGQGDCIFITNDNGNDYLIDGGSSSVSSVGKYRMIPFLKYQGVSILQAVFITHPDEDHCNGIKELIEIGEEEGIRIKNLILPDINREAKNSAYIELEQQAAAAGITVSYMGRGQQLKDGELALTCMHPQAGAMIEDANEYSLVLLLSYGTMNGLLTGDVEGQGEAAAWEWMKNHYDNKDKVPMTFLKVAHHGSKYSTNENMLWQMQPGISVISCGEKNKYGHPHKELLERLKAVDSHVYSTPERGAVTIKTDGRRLWISSFYQNAK